VGQGRWARRFSLDDLDHRLIACFSQNARKSNRQVAIKLGVTEATVRARLKRLQTQGVVQITAITNVHLAGSPRLLMMGIEAKPADVSSISAVLVKLPYVTSVVEMLGRYSLLATGLFQNMEEADEVIRTQIRSLSGVMDVETSWCMKTLKYDARLARLAPLD
jgi:Lrp/AsnC family transcriptional regulator for asnA, asnC and gidA